MDAVSFLLLPLATLGHAIQDVVSARANKKMLWVPAFPIIAFVQRKFVSVSNIVIQPQMSRQPMSGDFLPLVLSFAVTVLIERSNPVPATRVWLEIEPIKQ